jgi:hypothetical protein
VEKGGRFSFLRQKVGFHLSNLSQLGTRELFGYIGEKLRMAEEAGKSRLAASLKSLKDAVNGAAEEAGAEAFIQEINHEAGWNFVPTPFAGRITVFRPRKNYDFFPDPQMGWTQVVGAGLEVVELPINPHAMLIEPFATRLAAELRTRIAGHAPALGAARINGATPDLAARPH